jgi:hypothetical protein
MITSFLNLVNGDWLRRPAWWLEALVLVVTGALLGGALCPIRPLAACLTAAGIGVVTALGTIWWSYATNFWFPWLVIAGGQAPCALAWSLATRRILRAQEDAAARAGTAQSLVPAAGAGAKADQGPDVPDTPDYELIHPPFGEGAYGKVWLARNAVGQWQALKAVYLAKFGENSDPYEREFSGIRRYKPISHEHPGLLRVDFVSQKKAAGYFYYVMDLGDALDPGWEQEPSTYRPRDLVNERRRCPGEKLPVRECLRIGAVLADALDFLHRQGLTHCDIKPQNIIFVNGQPKLADVGLMAEIRRPDQEGTFLGTPAYMPPPPEASGTPRADIYALGMVLYVISTGCNAAVFPTLSTTLTDNAALDDFFALNAVVLKACQPDCTQRYASAAEMRGALEDALKALEGETAASL